MTEPYKPKLIEVAMPLAAINAGSASEKSSGARGHPQNLHRWWARRPLAAARVVLLASLLDDPSGQPDLFPSVEAQDRERERLLRLLEALAEWQEPSGSPAIDEAKAELAKTFGGDLPIVLDPFAGGGAIPLEAQRLGLTAAAGDLNPVAVLVQKVMLEVAPRFSGSRPVALDSDGALSTWAGAQGLASDVLAYGQMLEAQVASDLSDLYPPVADDRGRPCLPIAWVWARTVASPDPSWSGSVPLVKSWTLAKKKGKPAVWVEPMIDRETGTIEYAIRTGGTPPDGNVTRSGATCLATGTPITFDYVRKEGMAGRLGQQLIAIAAERDGERVYLAPTEAHQTAAELSVPDDVPRVALAGKARVNVTLYGMEQQFQLYTPRQLHALAGFCDRLEELRGVIASDALTAGFADDGVALRNGGSGAEAYADAVVTLLAFAIDKASDFWSSICSWNAPNSQIRFTFSRQAIPMTWDFVEAYPFSGRMASWRSMLDGVVKGLTALPQGPVGSAEQRDAAARVKEVGNCVVSTDPPYYDNISYADLADYFYVWLRRSVGRIWPDECATLVTPKAEELIASPSRAGSKAAALKHFEVGIREVFEIVHNVQDRRIPATIFYAFKQTEASDAGRTSTGWEKFLQGLVDAGLAVTATWPLRTEREARPVAVGANALASSIVLACRPRPSDAPMETRGGFVAALKEQMPAALRVMQSENIAPVDLAQSAIGPGMSVFSSYSRVVEADGTPMAVRAALGLINEVLGEVLSAEEAELDADSRFALTWFEQFGHNPGSFGDADVLARAKDTSVSGVVEAGIAVSRDGKLRLLERHELPPDWSPLSDERSTVWESTQHLIRRLSESESSAAALLTQLGGVADRARQMAYLLYGVCERKGWTDEALAYNGLIMALPELTRVAGSASSGPNQQSLI